MNWFADFTFNASVSFVDIESLRTEFADGLMVLDVTRCVPRTGGVQTRVDAFIIPASPMRRATAVSQANGICGGAVFETDAHRFVV